MAINPLQKPIDYLGMVPQVDIGQGIENLGAAFAKRQERIDAEAQAAVYKTDLEATLADPSQTNWAILAAKYPKNYQGYKAAGEMYGADKLKNDFNQGFEISTALENVNPGVAKSKLDIIIEAKKNSGESPLVYEQIRDAIDRGEITEAQAGVNAALVIIDPVRFKNTVDAQVAGKTAANVITEAEAKTDKAVADAESARAVADTAEEKAAADLKLAKAKADQADIQAKFEERNQNANLKKLALDSGLTSAQIDEVLVKTRKLGHEAKKAALELKALEKTGGVDPDKIFGYEEKLRKEWQTRKGQYTELKSTYGKIKISAASKNGPGDIALITGFMKMIDEGAIVRETDFALARDTGGLLQELKNQAGKLQSGAIFTLDSKQRQEYVNLANQYLNAAEERANQEKKSLGYVVKKHNLNPENVFGVDSDIVTINGKTYTRPAIMTNEQWTAYKKEQGGL
jgi:hypothetical protein